MIWKATLIWDIGGILCDVTTTIYNIKVLGEVETNIFARNYVMTPWWLVAEAFWLGCNWLIPYLLYRRYRRLGLLVCCPLSYGFCRWRAGLTNLWR